MVAGDSAGRATRATLARWGMHRLTRPGRLSFNAAERCRAILAAWDADPYPTQAVQVEASVLRALLERLDAAESVDVALDLRQEHRTAT